MTHRLAKCARTICVELDGLQRRLGLGLGVGWLRPTSREPLQVPQCFLAGRRGSKGQMLKGSTLLLELLGDP
eukprot:1568045-Prymnesium_polylepis.1